MLTSRPTLLARLHAVDLALFRRAARAEGPVHDHVLPRLTRLADHSKLWMAIALLMALTGRPAARRAAFRGLLSIAAASATANVVIKPIARRRRPDTSVVLVRRLARRIPLSTSFPSGHTASAAAFATAASLEAPASGLVLAPLAAAVGASRVTTGVHYPGDVLAGAAIGIGSSVLVRRVLRQTARTEDERPSTTYGDGAPLPDGKGLSIVVNPSSGSGDAPTDDLRAAFPDARIDAEEGDMEERLLRAASDASALGVAGGDGTLGLAASVASAASLPLLVIPSGTLNHFARDLGIADVGDAIEAARAGATASVDTASIAGRTFLNTASLGIYSEIVDERERHEDQLGKWVALAFASWRVLRRTEPMTLEIDGRIRRVWVLFAGNGRYGSTGSIPSKRTHLDDGLLDIRLIHADRSMSRWRVITGLLTDRLRRAGVYEEWTASRVQIRIVHGPTRAACDGETFDAPSSFALEKTGQIAVYAPRPSE